MKHQLIIIACIITAPTSFCSAPKIVPGQDPITLLLKAPFRKSDASAKKQTEEERAEEAKLLKEILIRSAQQDNDFTNLKETVRATLNQRLANKSITPDTYDGVKQLVNAARDIHQLHDA